MKLINQIKKISLAMFSITTVNIEPVLADNSFAEIEPLEFSSEQLGVPLKNTDYEGFGKPTNVINWEAGERVEDILRLKDFADTGLGNLNLSSILNSSGIPVENFTLADFKLLKNTNLKKLVEAVPFLKSTNLSEVLPLYDLVKKGAGIGTAKSLANSSIGSMIKEPKIGNLSLNQINLEDYSLDSIPQLITSPIKAFPDWGNQLISEIPGLVNLPFDALFAFLAGEIPVAQVDLVLGEKEGYIDNTITGSYQVGFEVNCYQENCEHLELVDYLPIFTGFEGKRWIGKSHQVEGGTGCLKGEEPTGRHPFGDSFKLVLTDVDEAEGRADFSLYFRFCFICGCSPYLVGPIPFFSVSEKDPLFIGF